VINIFAKIVRANSHKVLLVFCRRFSAAPPLLLLLLL
jgi:hypothetical protein